MTDIFTTTPMTTRRISVLQPHFLNLGIAAAFKTVNPDDAFGLVYAAQIDSHPYKPSIVSDEYLIGRDQCCCQD